MAADGEELTHELDKVMDELRSEQEAHRSLREQVQQLTSILDERERRSPRPRPSPRAGKDLQEQSWQRFVALASRHAMTQRDLLLVSLDTLKKLVMHCGITSTLDAARIELFWKLNRIPDDAPERASPLMSASSRDHVEVSQSVSSASPPPDDAGGSSPSQLDSDARADDVPVQQRHDHATRSQVSDTRSAQFVTPRSPGLGDESMAAFEAPTALRATAKPKAKGQVGPAAASALIKPVGEQVRSFAVPCSPLRPHLTPRKSLLQRGTCSADPNGVVAGGRSSPFLSSPVSPSSPKRESSRKFGYAGAAVNPAPYLIESPPKGIVRRSFPTHNASKFASPSVPAWDGSPKVESKHIPRVAPVALCDPNSAVHSSPSRDGQQLSDTRRRQFDGTSGFDRPHVVRGKRVTNKAQMSSVSLRHEHAAGGSSLRTGSGPARR